MCKVAHGREPGKTPGQCLPLIAKNLELLDTVLADAKLGTSPRGWLNEFLHRGLDHASNTLPKMWAAHGADRDGFGQEGRYTLR